MELINKKLIIMLSIIFLLGGCSINHDKKNEIKYKDPEQVIEDYFHFFNEKNESKILSTFTETYEKYPYNLGLKNTKSYKLISTKDLTEDRIRYMSSQEVKDKGITYENYKVYEVRFEWIFIDETIAAAPSGDFYFDFTLVRKDKYSDWLIDSIGQ